MADSPLHLLRLWLRALTAVRHTVQGEKGGPCAYTLLRHATKECVKELRAAGLAVVVVMEAAPIAADEGSAREREGVDHGPLANVSFSVRAPSEAPQIIP